MLPSQQYNVHVTPYTGWLRHMPLPA